VEAARLPKNRFSDSLPASGGGRALGLDITDEALAAFLAEDDGEPVTLVNLVRVQPDGAEAYAAYLTAIAPCFERAGAETVWLGQAAGAALIGDERYDHAAVVRYPSRQSLADLLADPEFVAAAELRHAALAAGILYPFRG
jgi:uncharacterized protein (DUF1330 family)